jgi:hypothetical protein
MTLKRADEYEPEEAEQRLRKILRGAFAAPPTPLKKVPTRTGKQRTRTKKTSASRASAKTSPPET